MQSPAIAQGRLISVDAGWTAGMNTVRHPWFLREDQYRRGVNLVNRGGVVQTRPGFAMRLILPEGNLQGMTHFQVTKDEREDDYLVFAVDGRVYVAPFPLEQPKTWENFRLRNIRFDANAPMVYFCVAEKNVTTTEQNSLQLVPSHNILMMQDGVSQAAFWDGDTARHLTEAAPYLETPRGTWMAFSGNRLWVARGKRVIASDIFNPIKFVERTEGASRGDFSFAKPITGMSNFIGDNRAEVVAVFTEDRSELILSGIRTRSSWATTANMQSVLFPSTGCVAGRSIVFQAGLMWWYSLGGLVASDAAASTNLTSQVNFKDAEMAFSKQFLSGDLSGICGLSFENYLLMSMPVGQNLNSETFVLDYAPMSEASAEKIPAWSSVWTGIRPVQWVSASIDGRRRAFAASVDYKALSDGSHNHVWEVFAPEREDSFFELNPDFTTTEFRRPIYCEFETRLMGDGHDLKSYSYADVNLIEVAGDVTVTTDYRGTRGQYKPVLCKKIIAPIFLDEAGAEVPADERDDFKNLRKQSRRVTTETALASDGCPTCESEYSENVDKAFGLLIRWCGQLAVESIRLFMEPFPEKSEGRCEQDETSVCLVGEDGKNYVFNRQDGFIPIEDLYETAEGTVWAATESFTQTLTCPAGSVTGPLSVTAVATYRSRISQDDADSQALLAAEEAAIQQANYLRSIYPCYYDSVQFVTRHCYSVLNDSATAMTVANDGRIILGGYFWNDKTVSQGKLTAKNSSGGRITTFVSGNGLVSNPSLEPSTIHVEAVAISPLDQSIFVVGEFSQYGGNSRANIVKLNSDGSIAPVTFGTGFTGGIPKALGIQSSGLPVIGGTFTGFNGSSMSHPLIRLLADGTKDNSFASGNWSRVGHVLIQPDDKVILLGYKSGVVHVERKLASNGNDDTTFTHYTVTTAIPTDCAFALQSDGKVLVSFDNANAGKNIIRLNSNGTVDASFNVGTGLDAPARGIVVLDDGSVIAAGNFTSYNGTAVPRIVKLDSSGTIVSGFNSGSGFNAAVNELSLDSTKTVLYAAGAFTEYAGDTDNSSRFCRIDPISGAILTSRLSVTVAGSHRGTISQADSDQIALLEAEQRAIEALPCL
jgi:uncharacterized delta-60 repeat protein